MQKSCIFSKEVIKPGGLKQRYFTIYFNFAEDIFSLKKPEI